VPPSRLRIGARSRILGRAGLLAGPAALALAGVAFAVAAGGPPNGVTTRGWVEAPSDFPSPDARDDYVAMAEDSGAIIVPVLRNDKDQDQESGKELEVTGVNDPPHGTAIVIQGAGSRDQISYSPDQDYCNDPSGRDDVRYEVTNSLGNTDVARVRVRVTCVDDPSPDAGKGTDAQAGASTPGATGAGTQGATGAGTQTETRLDTIKPRLSSGSLSSSFFRAAGSGPSTSARVGTTVFFTLSEPATVRFSVQRRATGRGGNVGGKCRKPNGRNQHGALCNLWVRVKGSFTVFGRAGTTNFRFGGRIGGRTLEPGRYRLNSRATDLAGNSSGVKRRRFRIVP
jgi:Bacterial Ig domain